MDAEKLKYNIIVTQDIYGDYTITIPLYLIENNKCEIKTITKNNLEVENKW